MSKSSSTPMAVLKSLKEKLDNESNGQSSHSDDEYLDLSIKKTVQELGAEGIAILFSHFNYALHTFQYIKTDIDTGKTHSPVYTFKQTQKEEALRISLDLNKNGYDVYFMVNEGDGIVHEGKRVCRSQASVTSISRCFIDTDSCPVEKVNAYLSSIELSPHLVIESSPARFHYYFFLESQLKDDTGNVVNHWKAVQNILHRLGDPSIRNPSKTLGTDATMHDYSKVLRVPGFVHIGKKSVVKVVTDNDLPLYSLQEMFERTNAQAYIDYNIENYGTESAPSALPNLHDTTIIEAGERFAALQSLSLHLANTESEQNAFSIFSSFVINRLDNKDNVYATKEGSLTEKSLSLFKSAFSKVNREQTVHIESIRSSLGAKEDAPSPWHLPDEFYLSAPNGFGDVIRQVMDHCLYPSAALSFGTFLTGLSILRARTNLTPYGSSPALYVLNVAETGFGKSDPMTMLQNFFKATGLIDLVENRVRSDRGIYEHLKSNDNAGIFILDEASHMLSEIQKPNATSFHKYIGEAFLSLYSAGAMKGVSFGKQAGSSTAKGKPAIVIDNPVLAMVGYTVPFSFKRLFNADSVMQGLFQRFIPILPRIPADSEDNLNPLADNNYIIKSDLFSVINPAELDDNGDAVSPLTSPDNTRVRCVYTPEAKKYFDDLCNFYRAQWRKLAREGEPIAGVYTRLAEQVERIASTLSLEEVSLEALTYAHSFIESRHKATLEIANSSIMKGDGAKTQEQEDIIVNAVTRLCREGEVAVIRKRDLFRKVRNYFKDLPEFEKILSMSVEMGKLTLIKNFKEDKKGAKPSVGVTLEEVI